MATARKKRKAGTLTHDDTSLLLRFRQSRARSRMLWSLEGVSYDAKEKQWRVPYYEFERLERSSVFSSEELRYDLDLEYCQTRARKDRKGFSEAWQAIRNNPFSVAEEHIEQSSVPVRVCMHVSGAMVLLQLRSCMRKKKERQEKLLRDFPNLVYRSREKGIAVPILDLASVLRWLRDEGIYFAVAESCGSRLAASAELRKKVLAGAVAVTADALEESLLYPHVAQLESGRFTCSYGESWYLGRLYPDLSGREASEHAASMDIRGLLTVAEQALHERLNLWADEASLQCLKDYAGEGFYLPGLLRHEVLVFDAHPKKGIVLYAPEAEQPALSGSGNQQQSGGLLAQARLLRYQVPDTSLQDVQTYLGNKELVYTEAYCQYRDILHERRKLFEERLFFESLQDTSPGMVNRELEKKLFPHQRVAVAWLLARKHSLLGDDMGLGKTLSVLAAFEELAHREEVSFLLVLCPNSLVLNWQREAATWLKDFSLAVLPDTKKERIVALDALLDGRTSHQGMVLNYEAARLDYVQDALRALCHRERVYLCCDESQRVKNPRSKTFQAVSNIRTELHRSVLLSGTPAPRAVSDLWSQVYLVDQGLRFGSKYYEWLQDIAELGTRYSPYAVKRFIPERIDDVISATREILLRRRKEDVLSLPEKIFMVRDVELAKAQKQRYEEVRKELLLRMTGKSGQEFQRSIQNVLEQYLRAVQIASNPRLIDPSYEGNPAKFVELDSIVQDLVEEQKEKLVIWTNYRLNVDELVERYRHLGAAAFTGDTSRDERERIVQTFQRGGDDIQIIVAIPSAGGVGITLTAAQTAVYLDKTWNAEHWMQSIDRIHRIGQTAGVRIISLHACTIDRLISRNLSRKVLLQQKVCGDDGSDLNSLLPDKNELLEAVQRL